MQGRRHARNDHHEGILMRISARNQLKIGGGKIVTSSITNEAVDELGIKAKDTVTVVVKASDVMIAVD
jgi:molybdopterin-binding protein